MPRFFPKSARWILLLTLVIVLSYWKIVFTKQFSILWPSDIVAAHYAWYTYAAQWIQKGILPLWDPTRYGGNTFIGEMQNGLFYPLNLALYLAPLDSNGLLSERLYNLFFVFSHWLAAVSMFLLARHLKLNYLPAVVAGMCFGLAGLSQSTPWLFLLDAMIWLPLVVLFIFRAFDSTTRLSQLANAGIAGIVLGLTVLAGSIQIAIIDGIVVTTLTAYLWISKRPKTSLSTAAIIFIVVGETSILFGAVQLLPTYEYTRLAYRWVGTESPIRPFDKIPYSTFGDYAFGPQSLFAFVLGELPAGKSEGTTTYFGVLPLILAIIGVRQYWANPLVRYLAAIAVLALVYTWGPASLLHGVLYLTPFVDVIREPDRFIYMTNFAMAILAGFGVQFLFVDHKAGEALPVSGLLSLLKWGTSVFALVLLLAGFRFPISVSEKTYLSFFFLVSAYALIRFAARNRSAGVQAVLVFLIAWDIYSFGWIIASRAEKQKIFADSLDQLRYDRKLADFIKAQPGMPRVHFDMEGSHNIGNAYGVPITYAMSATMLKDYTDGIGYDRQRELLGVRYIVRLRGGKRLTAKSTGPPIYSDGIWEVSEHADALSRAWIVHHVEVDSSKQRPLKQLIDPAFDLKQTAVIDEPLQSPVQAGLAESRDSVRWLAYEPNHLEVEATTDAAGLLVLGEVFYPGWTALVDGSPAKLYRAYGLVRAVLVPRGTHDVSLRYKPASFRWGAILTIATFLLVFAVNVAALNRARRLRLQAS